MVLTASLMCLILSFSKRMECLGWSECSDSSGDKVMEERGLNLNRGGRRMVGLESEVRNGKRLG